MLEPVEEKLHIKTRFVIALAASAALIVFGVLTGTPSGYVLAICALWISFTLVKHAFGWSPDRHARRKFLLVAGGTVLAGGLGAVAIDTVTILFLETVGRHAASPNVSVQQMLN